MKTEGQVRIPSGCAIAAMISRDGNKMSGETITNAMKPMHDRSNGLGGGFAGYGIYPEYKDFYAFHMFFDSRAARKGCEAFLKERGFQAYAQTTDRVKVNDDYVSPVPHKTVAARAGLGWIGKNCLLVTPEYGPAVRISSLFTDAPLETEKPYTKSRCGKCFAVCRYTRTQD